MLQCFSVAFVWADAPAENAINESSIKLFRYFRRDQHTYCFIDLEFDWTVTESVLRRLATHSLDVEVFDSPDKLSPRAKTDFRTPKKMSLPHFAEVMLSGKQGKDWLAFQALHGQCAEGKKTEWLAIRLAEVQMTT